MGEEVQLNNQHLLPVLKEEGHPTFVNCPPCQSSGPQALRIRTVWCLWSCERFRKKTGTRELWIKGLCSCLCAAGTFNVKNGHLWAELFLDLGSNWGFHYPQVCVKCAHSSLDVIDICNFACIATFLGFKLSLLAEAGCENQSTAVFFINLRIYKITSHRNWFLPQLSS